MEQPQQPQEQKPEYVLVNDVTGTGPIKRVLKAVYYEEDEEGKEVKRELEFKVPFPPKSNCKQCYGRGYVGWSNDNEGNKILVVCRKCYPFKR